MAKISHRISTRHRSHRLAPVGGRPEVFTSKCQVCRVLFGYQHQKNIAYNKPITAYIQVKRITYTHIPEIVSQSEYQRRESNPPYEAAILTKPGQERARVDGSRSKVGSELFPVHPLGSVHAH